MYAVPQKADYEIRFPRVVGYRQAIRNRVVVDWQAVATCRLDPMNIPPQVEIKARLPNNQGRHSLTGPGKLERVDLNPYRAGRRFQALVFEMARDLTRDYATQATCEAPAHVLFPQLARIVERYLRERVITLPPADSLDAFLSPYYGWIIERLVEGIKPDTSQGEAPELPLYEQNRGPGSTAEVDFWTSREVRAVVRSHVNYVVADTRQWEQSAAYLIDTHSAVEAFVKNANLGFAIPYLHNGRPHDYLPDFIIHLNDGGERYLILEIKGHDELKEIKEQSAKRWVEAVNAQGDFGHWQYALVERVSDVGKTITKAAGRG